MTGELPRPSERRPPPGCEVSVPEPGAAREFLHPRLRRARPRTPRACEVRPEARGTCHPRQSFLRAAEMIDVTGLLAESGADPRGAARIFHLILRAKSVREMYGFRPAVRGRVVFGK